MARASPGRPNTAPEPSRRDLRLDIVFFTRGILSVGRGTPWNAESAVPERYEQKRQAATCHTSRHFPVKPSRLPGTEDRRILKDRCGDSAVKNSRSYRFQDPTEIEWQGMNVHAKQFIFSFGATLTTSVAVCTFAQSVEEQAVLAPIHAIFDGMSKRDAAAIKAPTLPGGTMVLMRNDTPAQMTFDAFAKGVGKPSKTQIEERIHIGSCGSTTISPWCGRRSSS